MTPSLQLKLMHAGLDEINISLHTLDKDQYAKMFGVDNALPSVLKNISFLSSTFPDKVKFNFMGLLNDNIPSQLVPMSQLSARYHIPISFLTTLNFKNKNQLLSDIVKEELVHLLGTPTIKTLPSKFGERYFYTYSNGAIWEFDDFRTQEYREDALNNKYCKRCTKNDQCIEGPYALRVTNTGTLKPCIIRNDNTLPLFRGQSLFKSER